MTLDELIERLQQIRRECPAAATAHVVGYAIDDPVYQRGEVWFGDYDPDTSELIELDVDVAPLPRGEMN